MPVTTTPTRSIWSWVNPKTPHDKHLFAFYSYAWACEVFSLVSAAVIIPIFLEQLAKTHGHIGPDYTIGCLDVPEADREAGPCKVSVFGVRVETASFSLFVKSASVAVQAVTVISISVLADVAQYRHSLLLLFSLLGSFSSILHLLIPTTIHGHLSIYLAALFSIVAVVCFGDSFVCLNAFLGDLVREDEEVRELGEEVAAGEGGRFGGREIDGDRGGEDVYKDGDDDYRLENADSQRNGSTSNSTTNTIHSINSTEQTALLALTSASSTTLGEEPPTHPLPLPLRPSISALSSPTNPDLKSRYAALISLKTTQISSLGIGIGYTSGVGILCLSLIPIQKYDGSLGVLKSVISCTGAWWAIFTIPSIFWLPGAGAGQGGGLFRIWRDGGERELVRRKVGEGWRRLGGVFRSGEVGRLRDCYWFLVAWGLLADAFNTTTSVAILFSRTTLHLPPSTTILLGILTQFTAIFSAMSVPYIQAKTGWTGKGMMVGSVVGVGGMCVWGGVGGIGGRGEMLGVGVWFGLMFGPFNALSRSVFSELVPPGHSARFFSLFSITDKGASFLGPAVIALIADRTGNIRHGFWFLLGLLGVGAGVLIWGVDLERGRGEGERYAREEARRAGGGDEEGYERLGGRENRAG